MTLALANGHYTFVLRLVHQVFFDVEALGAAAKSSLALEVMMNLVGQALVALRAPDAVRGLCSWAKKTLNIRLAHIEAAVDCAAER